MHISESDDSIDIFYQEIDNLKLQHESIVNQLKDDHNNTIDDYINCLNKIKELEHIINDKNALICKNEHDLDQDNKFNQILHQNELIKSINQNLELEIKNLTNQLNKQESD